MSHNWKCPSNLSKQIDFIFCECMNGLCFILYLRETFEYHLHFPVSLWLFHQVKQSKLSKRKKSALFYREESSNWCQAHISTRLALIQFTLIICIVSVVTISFKILIVYAVVRYLTRFGLPLKRQKIDVRWRNSSLVRVHTHTLLRWLFILLLNQWNDKQNKQWENINIDFVSNERQIQPWSVRCDACVKPPVSCARQK